MSIQNMWFGGILHHLGLGGRGALSVAFLPVVLMVTALLASPETAAANVLGPHAARCGAGATSAVLVEVTGLKVRRGSLRVQSYGGNPGKYFDKGAWLERIDVPVPATGGVSICVPVPKPGVYAISVRHDLNGNHKSDMSDGGGMSGNPEISLMDLIMKSKPSPKDVAFNVGQGTRVITVVMNYVQGGSFRPVRVVSR